MSPVPHTEAAPHLPGSLPCGKRPHDYGRGRVCTQPGCGTILRRTHKGPVCDPCTTHAGRAGEAERSPDLGGGKPHARDTCGGDRDHHARGDVTTAPVRPPAGSNPVGQHPDHSGPAARATKEEKVGKEDRREDVLLVFARDPSRCFNAGDVVGYLGVSPSCVYKNLKSLVASGDLVKDGPGVYRLPKTEDAKTAPAIPPAPSSLNLRGAQPANEAPASEPLPPQARLAPFAGIDYELHVIGALVSQIESLAGHETRVRVAAYVASRFL